MTVSTLPVLVGLGQSLSPWQGEAIPNQAPSPLSLCVEASRKALADAGLRADTIDTLAVVRTFEDSLPNYAHPFGKNTNLPSTIARDLGASPARLIYAPVGGDSPQALANEMAARIFAGEIDCALITGAEAQKAAKAAQKKGLALNWADTADQAFEDRGLGPPLLHRSEIKHGLVAPAYIYALFENAQAAKAGQTRTQRRESMANLLAPFAKVAAGHPYAQFKTAFSAEYLATPSAENYPFADPYLKWHMAQDAVNQGGALILMSESKADECGVPIDKRIYLHGGGEAAEGFVCEREELARSRAMQSAISRALEASGLEAGDIDLFDLYSCFPCAVFSALAVLGLDPEQEPRPLTVTGGLPFFGGAGNGYSLHAIASMAMRLRYGSEKFGLVLANGGWMSKVAVGIWSSARPEEFIPAAPAETLAGTVRLAAPAFGARIEAYTLVHAPSGAMKGIVLARNPDQTRFLAKALPEALPRLQEEPSPIELPIAATSEGEVIAFTWA